MAINQSDPYIEVRSHMNLTGLQAPEGETHVLGIIPEGVVSIQVVPHLHPFFCLDVPSATTTTCSS